MEAADRDFCRGIQYLAAALRLEDWSCDDVTDSKLRRLASTYRDRAYGLLMGVGEADRAGDTASLSQARVRRGPGARAL